MGAPPAPERMTRRARAYMGIAASRHLILGVMCIGWPEHFSSGSYAGIKNALPLTPSDSLMAWGGLFVLVGLICAVSAGTGREEWARPGLMWSVIVTGFWVGGFIAALLAGLSAGPTGVVIWAAVAAKDVTMLRDPLRNPFEPLLREVMAGNDRRA